MAIAKPFWSESYAKYNDLETKLLEGRKTKTLTDAENSEILFKMGELWWSLSSSEQEDIIERTRQRFQNDSTL